MSQAPKRTVNRTMKMARTDDFYDSPYTVVERVSLHMFDPRVNSNKFYIAEVHQSDVGLGYRFFVNHGRVGTKGSPKSEVQPTLQAAITKFNAKVREKLRKGYNKVDLATVTAGSDQGTKKVNADALQGVVDTTKVVKQSSKLPSKVADFVKHIYEEANQAVAISLTGSVKTDIKAPLGNLGINGINRGRQILNQLARAVRNRDRYMIEHLSVQYYNVIPRKMPSNLRTDTSWILSTNDRISKEMDVLDLYEDSLRMLPIMGLSDIDSKYEALNCDIAYITDPDTLSYINYKVSSTHAANHNYKLRVVNAFEVNLRNAPQFNNSCGNVRRLFHGSRSANLVGILSSYLKLPSNLGSDIIKTGTMFGPGIYFASDCTKSANYSFGSWSGRPNKYKTAFLLICEVALGNVYKVQSPHYFLSPPSGYHSVMGVKGPHLINNEFIVYRPDQVRVRYVVEVEKY